MSNSDRRPLPQPTPQSRPITVHEREQSPVYNTNALYLRVGHIWATHLLSQGYPSHVVRKQVCSQDNFASKCDLRAMWDTEKDAIYRVCISPSSGVEVLSIGIVLVDDPVEGLYLSVDALPEWIQQRIAVLSMMSPIPPTTKVDGVGQRIDVNTFWIQR